MESAGTGAATELRLALVCYGGVSLAVYMHGITKELHKVVCASRAFDETSDLDQPNPFESAGAATTEAAYFEALRSLAREGRRLRVTIDIIAGTSAGGINGVVLGKALARDTQQERLKRLWIDEGDLKKLLRAPAVGGVRTRAVLAVLKLLRRARQQTSPLRGELMSTLLIDAMQDMDRGSGTATLIPPDGKLELFVTATDMHGFEVLVPSGVGGASQRDRHHAQVMEFRASRTDTSAFGPDATPALAFSARATASFPGAFAPVSLKSFGQEIGRQISVADDLFRYHYDEAGLRARDAWFADGGVLDNAPFDHVIDAIKRRPAQTEVLRRIVYIQPDPGRPLEAPGSAPKSREAPAWLAGLWQTAVVKGTHPILLELLKLRDMNWRIAQVGAIAESQMAQVHDEIWKALREAGLATEARPGTEEDPAAASRGERMLAGIDSQEAVAEVSRAMHAGAAEALGPGWPTYQRLKVEAAGRRLADEIALRFTRPPDSGRASFVRAALAAWARSRPEWIDSDPSRLVALLGPVDVPYRERRVMFLLAGVNSLYRHPGDPTPSPPRDELDRLKGHAWRMLEDLQSVPRDVVRTIPDATMEFLQDANVDSQLLDSPETFAAAHHEDFNKLFLAYRQALENNPALKDGGAPLWQIFEQETKTWDPSHRLEMLARYVGFPLWDGIIFPTVSLAELPQFTPIGVSQFSPLTATALRTPEAGKLKGVSLKHFGAFLDPDWRENDYLWGRLDAAELILRTLHEGRTATPQQPGEGPVPEPGQVALQAAGGLHLVDALTAVLDSEGDLQGETVTALRPELEQQIRDLAATLGAPGRRTR